MTSVDVATDVAAGASWSHVASEVTAIIVVLAILAWLWVGKMAQMKSAIRTSEQRVQELRREAERWQEQVAAIKPGLSDAIDKQFDAWQLTNAEREIARLILKGLANKEIAAVRASSEQTIKQQTNAIYRKSGLASRGQLAGFFLEDLF
jgi:DNA-binding NarL/FixJ family response regulator